MITKKGKEYIARKFGVNNCFAMEEIVPCTVYTDGTPNVRTLDTSTILFVLVTEVADKVKTAAGTFTLANLLAANDGSYISMMDALEIEAYCITGAPPVTPPVTPPPTGAKDYEIINPTVNCDSNKCYARFNLRNNSSSASVYIRVEIDGAPCYKRYVYILRGATKPQVVSTSVTGLSSGYHNLTIVVGKITDTDTYTHKFLVGGPGIEPPVTPAAKMTAAEIVAELGKRGPIDTTAVSTTTGKDKWYLVRGAWGGTWLSYVATNFIKSISLDIDVRNPPTQAADITLKANHNVVSELDRDWILARIAELPFKAPPVTPPELLAPTELNTMSVTADSAIPLWIWDEDGEEKLPCTRYNAMAGGTAFGITVCKDGYDKMATLIIPHTHIVPPFTMPFDITLSDSRTPVHLHGRYTGTVYIDGGKGEVHVKLTSYPTVGAAPPVTPPSGVPGVTIAVDKTTCSVNQQIRLTGTYTSEDGRLLVGHDLGFHGYLKGAKKYLGKVKTTSGGRYSFTYTPTEEGTWQFTAYDDYTSPKVTVTVSAVAVAKLPAPTNIRVTNLRPDYAYVEWNGVFECCSDPSEPREYCGCEFGITLNGVTGKKVFADSHPGRDCEELTPGTRYTMVIQTRSPPNIYRYREPSDKVSFTFTTPSAPPVAAAAPPEAIKAWIVANYGDGTRVTSGGWLKLYDANMANTLAPLPSGYTKASITEEVVIWAKNNPNYTVSTPTTPTTPIYTATPSGPEGTLAVTAEDSETHQEVDWGLVRLRSPTATSGGKYIGILPFEGQVEAKTYNVAVTAKGYSESVKKATVRANQRTSISVPMYSAKFASLLKIVAGGPAYLDGISFKEFEVLFVGDERKKDWARVETTITETFQVQMTWYLYEAGVATANLQRATSLFGSLRGVLLTETKTLSPNMTSTERHLDFPKWDVPSAPGYYRVTFGLLMG